MTESEITRIAVFLMGKIILAIALLIMGYRHRKRIRRKDGDGE